VVEVQGALRKLPMEKAKLDVKKAVASFAKDQK
jgi:hypothetical protein